MYLGVCFLRGSQSRYSYIVSEPLGRSSYKERYLFLYRYTEKQNTQKTICYVVKLSFWIYTLIHMISMLLMSLYISTL